MCVFWNSAQMLICPVKETFLAVQLHGCVVNTCILKSTYAVLSQAIRTFSTGQTLALRWAEQRNGVDLDQYPSLQRSRAAGHP